MPFFALLNMIATCSWLAAQWLSARSFDATTHIVLSFMSFPAYIFDSVKEGITNWYNFFPMDLPLYFAAIGHTCHHKARLQFQFCCHKYF